VQHQLVWMTRGHTGVALRPIVGYSIGEYTAVSVESRTRDGTWSGIERWIRGSSFMKEICLIGLTLQSGACVFIPEVDGAVRALNIDKYVLVSAEKGYIPQVENVPWTGWKEISLTAYTSA
jgi:hypothetical protein